MKRVEDVFGQGWERLKDLQRVDGTWLLNESLADFMGLPLAKLQEKVAASHYFVHLRSTAAPAAPAPAAAGARALQHIEVIGTALALAFLEAVFRATSSSSVICERVWKGSVRSLLAPQ